MIPTITDREGYTYHHGKKEATNQKMRVRRTLGSQTDRWKDERGIAGKES